MWERYKIDHSLMTSEEYFEQKEKSQGSAKEYVNQKYMSKMTAILSLASVADLICVDAKNNLDDFTKRKMAESTLIALWQNLDEIQEGIKTLFGVSNDTDKDLSGIVNELQESFKRESAWVENRMSALETLLEQTQIKNLGEKTDLNPIKPETPIRSYRKELE